ncbi:AzlD domain-containing protein [Streptomyces ficellus]|uniref:AzlD domain-containing protein n=1 Tax=Streptomyces ficellus TaxID=1977088 RepID=A0A6I6FT09_9ACTN|nr:AzlD domain-containing protein [Streptomyces ficellus]QGV80136.1 AzlD domain-containing protein [Streptomyces ficellus]
MTIVTIALMGAVTFAVRVAFFGPLEPSSISPRIERALPYVMPAVLMAIIVPSVLLAPKTGGGPSWLTPYLVGALVGFAVGAVRRDSFFLVFACSVAAFALTGLAL